MDAASRLDTVDNHAEVVGIARRHLGSDPRVRFHVIDGADFISRSAPDHFDFIYADTWPGKFSHLEQSLSLTRRGAIYFMDDLLPQPNWPEDHAPKVPALIERLEGKTEFITVKLEWASGLMLVVRTAYA